MLNVLSTLSRSYLTRQAGKSLLAIFGVAIGVATFVSVKAAQASVGDAVRSTAERLAGMADLQITGIGGVPESILEPLRALPSVESEQPTIEQVVEPMDSTLGGILVLGVDLVGDHEVRSYGFTGEDADVDDPLVFLAQPDSVALNQAFAARAGLKKGDVLRLRSGDAETRLTVRALLDPHGFASAYGGNVAITDVYAAQDLFGRGRRFDRIDIRLGEGADVDRATAEILAVVGPGYRVEPPDRRSADLARAADAIVSGFDLANVAAFGMGVFLIFNAFTIAIERRRRDIAILQSFGATPRQVIALFVAEAALLGAVGGVLGAALGGISARWWLGGINTTLEAVQGLTGHTPAAVTMAGVAEGLVIGVLAAVAGAYGPARRAAGVGPVESAAVGVFAARAEPSRLKVVSGVAGLVVAALGARFWPGAGRWVLAAVATGAVLSAILVTGAIVCAICRWCAGRLTWLMPVSGRLASAALGGRPRRTAGAGAVLSVGAALALGIAGYLAAVRGQIDHWLTAASDADLIVRAESGLAPSEVYLPDDVGARVRQVNGVRLVDPIRNQRVDFRGRSVTLRAIDPQTSQEPVPAGGQAFVSDVFARRFHIGRGDVVTLPSPTGPVSLRVAAFVDGYRATVTIDRALFVERWQDDRIDTLNVQLTGGADPNVVRRAIWSTWNGRGPLLVSTRAETTEQRRSILASLDRSTNAVVAIAMSVILVGALASLVLSVDERARDFGTLRAIGGVTRQVAESTVLEAVTLASASLLLAIPLGEALSWFLRVRVSGAIADFHFAYAYPTGPLLYLVVGLPVVTFVASWLPTRRALALTVREAIGYE